MNIHGIILGIAQQSEWMTQQTISLPMRRAMFLSTPSLGKTWTTTVWWRLRKQNCLAMTLKRVATEQVVSDCFVFCWHRVWARVDPDLNIISKILASQCHTPLTPELQVYNFSCFSQKSHWCEPNAWGPSPRTLTQFHIIIKQQNAWGPKSSPYKQLRYSQTAKALFSVTQDCVVLNCFKRDRGGDSSVVRAPDLWSKGRKFESLQERRENFLLPGRLSVLTLISVSVPPLCYRSST